MTGVLLLVGVNSFPLRQIILGGKLGLLLSNLMCIESVDDVTGLQLFNHLGYLYTYMCIRAHSDQAVYLGALVACSFMSWTAKSGPATEVPMSDLSGRSTHPSVYHTFRLPCFFPTGCYMQKETKAMPAI